MVKTGFPVCDHEKVLEQMTKITQSNAKKQLYARHNKSARPSMGRMGEREAGEAAAKSKEKKGKGKRWGKGNRKRKGQEKWKGRVWGGEVQR